MNWTEIFLGTIALGVLVMALIQVGAIIAAARVARQAQQTLASIQHEIRPLIAKASAVIEEASRTATLATAQVHKVDRLVSDLTRRVEETAGILQHAIVAPAREGLAIAAAVKATLMALRGFRGMRSAHGRHADDEDPLFIG
ncbi:MAG: hypothetical protein LC753_02765 [Acidobacteria bacterium]|nr:hypothetical protein [Acidobacteriota bacterium]MCA1649223.1 hypothetical protein [Acidobacteriota bacterium]